MSILKTPPCSPGGRVKWYAKILVTPTSKLICCIFCGKNETYASNRRKLYKCDSKTDACSKIEQLLGHGLSKGVQTDIICRNCITKIATALKRVQDLRDGYYKTQTLLKVKYTRLVAKRKCTTPSSSQKNRKKKSSRGLFQDNESMDFLRIGDGDGDDSDSLGVAPLSHAVGALSLDTSSKDKITPPTKTAQIQTESEVSQEAEFRVSIYYPPTYKQHIP